MVSEDPYIDELILQVFEEHEDIFFWPVISQKDAKTFVKFIHEKGAPYEEICKEIGEFEHNFSAWRKGLGRVGIGTRMIERINKTVESVIESDDEDNLQFNLKQLAKVNKKNEGKPQKSKVAAEKSPATPETEPKQQHHDLMNAMSKNIDKHIEQKELPKRTEPTKQAEPTKKAELVKQSEPLTNGNTSPKSEAPKTQVVVSATREPAKREPPKQEPVKKEENVIKREVIEEQHHKKVEEKVEEKVSPVPQKRISVAEKETDKVEETQQEKERRAEEKQQEDKEVDEVKKKMEAIRKKVELMKKQKAEKEAGAHPPSEPTEGHAPTQTAQSPSPSADSGDKYEAMRKRIEELRNKIKTEEEQRKHDDEQAGEQVPPKPKGISSSSKVESAPSEPVAPPQENEEEFREQNGENEEATEADDIYDSDLDPDNYDSDLEYDIYKDVQNLANLIQNEKLRQKERDGPGHLYIFSDSPSDERTHRIRVGATRSPDKKFRQAQSFNPSFKMVSCTAVGKRKAALREVHNVLNKYKLDSYDDWFSGPIDKVLQSVSTVTEKYGSGPSLSSFQTDSQC